MSSNGIPDPRPVALYEVEVEPHADERRQNVREDDRRIDAECVDRHERHLRGELGRPNHLEHRVPLAQRAVLGHVPTGLAQQPDGRSISRKPVARAEERRRRLGHVTLRRPAYAVRLCPAILRWRAWRFRNDVQRLVRRTRHQEKTRRVLVLAPECTLDRREGDLRAH